MVMLDTIAQVSCDEIGLDELEGEKRVEKFVADEVAPRIPENVRIITFDGFDGVGKSPLAGYLAAKLDLPVIGLDDFLEQKRDCFLEALKFDEVSNALAEGLRLRGRIIVEGCLVEAALERIAESPDFRLYVMRMDGMRSGTDHLWVREHDALYGDESANELIAKLKEQASRWAQMPEEFGGGEEAEVSGLECELIRYHRDSRPHDRADIIVKIVHRG